MSTDLARAALAFLLAALPAMSQAQGFAAMVSPPRFELEAKPGKTQRQVIEIMNADRQPAKYKLRTADWTLDDKAAVKLSDALAPGSCRPWVAIERREITVGAGARYRYRFEITPPADARGECRFALVLQGGDETVKAGDNISIPISGQIAVIVYVVMDGARPKLEVVRTGVVERDGHKVPVMYVRNSGDAHGRLAGLLEGIPDSGRKIDMTPSGLPILPGETREIPIDAAAQGDTRPRIAFPLVIRGSLEWNGNTTPFESRFGS